MATKAGRVEISDIRQGKTLWYVNYSPFNDELSPLPVFITRGAKKHRGENENSWIFDESIGGRIITPYFFPLNEKGEPCFDKFFISRSAALRYIARRQSNRIEALCEDRRIFVRGSKLLMESDEYGPAKLAQQAPSSFVGLQIGYYCNFFRATGYYWDGRVTKSLMLDLTQ